jgi:pimeloyl-ACP methyl ester carboxylesterase
LIEPLALALLRAVAERGAETGFFPTPSGALRFARRGRADAPDLLLVHGLGDSLAGWARVLPQLSSTFRVHAIDLPGHGLSQMPPDFRIPTMLAALGSYAATLRRPLYVGHSLGGWLCARLALQFAASAEAPAGPRGLVLVNPGGAGLPAEAWAPFLAAVRAADKAGARHYLDRAFHRAPVALRLAPRFVLDAMAAPALRGILAAVSAPDFLTAQELRSLSLPIRIVWGDADRLLPEGSLAFFRENLPRAELLRLPLTGHLPHVEAPRALAAAIARELPAHPRAD